MKKRRCLLSTLAVSVAFVAAVLTFDTATTSVFAKNVTTVTEIQELEKEGTQQSEELETETEAGISLQSSAAEDFNLSGTELWKYYGDDEVVTIPSNVTIIGYNAFEDNTTIKKVIIPNGVKTIQFGAFEGCTNLEYVEIPSSVEDIGSRVFYECSSLKEVILPDSVLNINEYAFYGCSSLTKVKLPKKLKEIDAYTFYGCHSLESIEIPSGVTSIGGHAFSGCYLVKTLDIPSGVTSIGEYAFSSCKALTKMNIPSGVKRIEGGMFSGCKLLNSVSLPDNITYIGDYAFYYCEKLTDISLPSKLTEIGRWAFAECDRLESITLPSKLEAIGDYAFYYCRYLRGNIVIPGSVKTMGEYAFANCYCISGVTIQEGVTEISENAFYYCTGLYTVVLPSTMKSIGNDAFLNCISLININLPDGLETLGDSCFYSCESLTAIDIPDSVKTIEKNAFRNCYKLETLDFPDKVTYIGERTFLNCQKLWGVKIPASVTSIKEDAFKNCPSDLMLVCDKNSYAEAYAKENDMLYRYTGEKLEQTITVSDVTKYVYSDNFWLGATTDGRGTISLVSDNEDVAEVNGTHIKPHTDGKATITVTAGETYHYKPATTTVTVAVIKYDQKVSVETTEYEKMEGDVPFALGASVNSNEELKYSSDNSEVASVDKKGNVTVGKAGKAVITIIAPNSTYYYEDKLTVTVNVKGNGKTDNTEGTEGSTEGSGTEGGTEGSGTEGSTEGSGTEGSTEGSGTEGSTEESGTEGSTEESGALGSTEGSGTSGSTEESGASGSTEGTATPGNMEGAGNTVFAKVTLSQNSYVYSGKAKKPKVTVKDTNGKVIEAKDYSVSYKNNVKVGKATVTVRFKDKNVESISTQFTIRPKATGLKSVTGSSKSVKIKWSKQKKQTTGYEIQYSTSPDFKNKSTKTVNVSKNTTSSKTIKKLKGNKKYYVRIRTYKTVKLNGEKVKIYSDWSAKKAVKVKKIVS